MGYIGLLGSACLQNIKALGANFTCNLASCSLLSSINRLNTRGDRGTVRLSPVLVLPILILSGASLSIVIFLEMFSVSLSGSMSLHWRATHSPRRRPQIW